MSRLCSGFVDSAPNGPGQGRPSGKRLRLIYACRLGPGKAPENFTRPGPALLRDALPGPLGTLLVDVSSDEEDAIPLLINNVVELSGSFNV